MKDGKEMGGSDGHPLCVIAKSDGLEVEIASGAMPRLAGVSEALRTPSGSHTERNRKRMRRRYWANA